VEESGRRYKEKYTKFYSKITFLRPKEHGSGLFLFPPRRYPLWSISAFDIKVGHFPGSLRFLGGDGAVRRSGKARDRWPFAIPGFDRQPENTDPGPPPDFFASRDESKSERFFQVTKRFVASGSFRCCATNRVDLALGSVLSPRKRNGAWPANNHLSYDQRMAMTDHTTEPGTCFPSFCFCLRFGCSEDQAEGISRPSLRFMVLVLMSAPPI